MTDHLHGSDDPFGIPARVLSLSDDFYGALGRVAALGALVELRFSDVVVQWGGRSRRSGSADVAPEQEA